MKHHKTLMAPTAAMIGAVILMIDSVIVAEFNTPAFNCGVGATPQLCNRVINPSDVGIFSKLAC